MVLSRRHLIFLILPLILLMLLTACERPLSSNDSESAEESAEATAVAEGENAEDDSAEDEAIETADEPDEPNEPDEPVAEDAEAETDEEVSDEAESSDPDVGGGTPDTAADEAADTEDDSAEDTSAEEAEAEETTDEETTSEESASDDESDESDEATDAQESSDSTEPTEEAAEAAAAAAASDESAGDEATTEDSASSEEQVETTSDSTLPATHTVAAGENLYRIGLQYGMSWVTLAAYNNLPNANYIRVGQVLQIPGGSSPSPAPPPTNPDEPGYTNYVVQPGDTLNSIGRKFGVSWVEIAEANGIVNPNLIYAGQVLKIPTSQPETPPSLTHTVKPGETLNRISLQYGVHWMAIAQANNIAPPYIIYPGQVLVIPSG